MVLRAANLGVDVEAGEQQGAFCGSLFIREDVGGGGKLPRQS